MKVFSKEKWMLSARADVERGVLKERDVDNAIRVWVDKYDGKSREELSMLGGMAGDELRISNAAEYINDGLRDEWFIEQADQE